PARAVPIVCARFGDDVEDAASGMPVFSAELVGEKRKFRDGFLDDRLNGAVHVNAVVVNTVNVEAVKPGTSAADGAARTKNATLLRGRTRDKNGKLLHVASERIQRQVVHDLTRKIRVDFGRLRLHEVGTCFDLNHSGNGAKFEDNRYLGDLIRIDK